MENQTPTAPTSWIDKLGGWITTTGQVVIGGLDLYNAGKQRIDALKSVDEDTVPANDMTAVRVNAGVTTGTWPSWVLPTAAVALVVLGIIVARKVR